MTKFLLTFATLGLIAGGALAEETSTTTITTTILPPPTVSTKDTETTTTTYPFSNLVTTNRKTTETGNGVAVQSESTVHAYPPGATVPPVGTSSTTTIQAR
jgi:hypothetical protein